MAPLAIIRNAKTTDHDLPKSHPWNKKRVDEAWATLVYALYSSRRENPPLHLL